MQTETTTRQSAHTCSNCGHGPEAHANMGMPSEPRLYCGDCPRGGNGHAYRETAGVGARVSFVQPGDIGSAYQNEHWRPDFWLMGGQEYRGEVVEIVESSAGHPLAMVHVDLGVLHAVATDELTVLP